MFWVDAFSVDLFPEYILLNSVSFGKFRCVFQRVNPFLFRWGRGRQAGRHAEGERERWRDRGREIEREEGAERKASICMLGKGI